jgi:hypothetical protein
MADTTVYTGFWTDHTQGCVLGGTLTLSNRSGNLLIAFFAVFVGIITVELWQLLCYAIHQIRSTHVDKDLLRQQQQVLLRNVTSTPKATLDFLRLGWAWRDTAPIRTWFWLPCVGALCTIAFNAAGLFSSRLAASPASVLVKSPHCGDLAPPWSQGFPSSNPLMNKKYLAAAVETFRENAYGKVYVDACQDQQHTGLPQCQQLVKGILGQQNFSVIQCPFGDGICMTDAIRVDTGYVSSNSDLGINSATKDSLLYRRVSDCTVLKQEGYVSDWTTEPPDGISTSIRTPMTIDEAYIPGDPSKYYHYGWFYKIDHNQNYTYRYNNYSNAAISTPYIVW